MSPYHAVCCLNPPVVLLILTQEVDRAEASNAIGYVRRESIGRTRTLLTRVLCAQLVDEISFEEAGHLTHNYVRAVLFCSVVRQRAHSGREYLVADRVGVQRVVVAVTVSDIETVVLIELDI